MRKLLSLLFLIPLLAQGDPPSRVAPWMVATDNPTSYVTFAFSGTNNLRAALRWIDTNWPTNIDITATYVESAVLDDYLLYTNLLDAGVAGGLLSSTGAASSYVAGTNISGATYNSTSKTWTVANQPGRLVDWMRLWSLESFSSSASSGASYWNHSTRQFTNWSVADSSGSGLLSFDTDTGWLTVPSNHVAVMSGYGSVRLSGTNIASSALRFYDLGNSGGATNASNMGALVMIGRRDVRSHSDNDENGGSGSLVFHSGTADKQVSAYWVYSKVGTNGIVYGDWSYWHILLYDTE